MVVPNTRTFGPGPAARGVQNSLHEDAAELDRARPRRAAVLARAAGGGCGRDWGAGGIHIDVERGKRLTQQGWEAPQDRLVAVPLRPRRQVGASCAGRRLDRLDTHLDVHEILQQRSCPTSALTAC